MADPRLFIDSPSPWVARWAECIARGPVLDVACGGGRHSVYLKNKGFQVVAVDRGPQALPAEIEFLQADLEDGSPWPLAGRRFGAVVVVNYLHRPLYPRLADSLCDGGMLIYETFMQGNEKHGKPSNPDFLLRPGELLEAFPGLSVIGFEQGRVERPKTAVIQRLCAMRGGAERAKIPAHDYR
jgi:SAM-dependent methyltransferase